jgi:hypothetical protein
MHAANRTAQPESSAPEQGDDYRNQRSARDRSEQPEDGYQDDERDGGVLRPLGIP